MSSFGLQMLLNASHTLVPALGSTEAEKMKKVYLFSDQGHNFEVRSGRMVREGFSPGYLNYLLDGLVTFLSHGVSPSTS